MSDRTVEDLQRELLAICRSGSSLTAWRIFFQWPLSRTNQEKVAELRKQIAAIDPSAALYYGWAGADDNKPIFNRRKPT